MRLTPEQFTQALAESRMEATGQAWARAVLVDGRKQADVARDASTTRQHVAQKVRQLLAAHKRAQGVQLVELPADLAERMASIMAEAERRKTK